MDLRCSISKQIYPLHFLPVLYNGGEIHVTLYSDNHSQFTLLLTSDITKDMESVCLKHGPDITSNVPPNIEASLGVIPNVSSFVTIGIMK
jgi:hypothetical protein